MIRHPVNCCTYCGGKAGVHLGDCPVTRQSVYPDIPVRAAPTAAFPIPRVDYVDRVLCFAGKWVAQLAAVFIGTFLAGGLLILLSYAWMRAKVEEVTRAPFVIPALNDGKAAAKKMQEENDVMQKKVDAVLKGVKK